MLLQSGAACGRRKKSILYYTLSALVFGSMLPAAAKAGDAPSWLPAASAPRVDATTRAGGARSALLEARAEDDRVDTEHIFGFSMGSDIGKKGEIELEIENVGRFNKRFGSYSGVGVLSQVKFVLTDNFRVAPGVSFASTQVGGVPGMIDNRRTALAGASLEFRYKLLDRDVMPFGLTLHAAPAWNRFDELTGFDVQTYGSEFAALMDRELIRNTLFATVNVWYSGGASRDLTSVWTRDSELSVNGALSYKVGPDLVLGAEARYVRAYDGLGLDRFLGDAVYLGPTFSMHLAHNVGLSGTWSTQVAGRTAHDHKYLDLDDFERHQAMLRFNYLF